jgi:pimeloyl-ACP methyl ester carboxylesterase
MAIASPDRVIRLADGRLLGYCEYGDPLGRPLLFFHGLPGSRLEGDLFDAAAAERGVRVIAVDRPGFGLSDFQPGRTLLHWKDDIAELTSALALEHFAVAGLSGGGPYAAVCAWGLPQRVTGAGLVSGAGPFDRDENWAGMSGTNRGLFRLARSAPFLVGAPMKMMSFFVGRFPDRAAQLMAKSLPAADRAVLERRGTEELIRDSREAFRSGERGAIYETKLIVRPWEFDLREISVPVHLWQGLDDVNVPPAMGKYLAETIPGCQAHFIPDAGHFWALDHAGEILDALVPSMAAA